jgi:hypothetical protein
MKTFLDFTNPYGGIVYITYRLRNFHENEYFRILVNGFLEMSTNKDTKFVDKG